MQTVKAAGIWLACGLVPLAIVFVGMLPDGDGLWPAVVMPMFMLTLFLWLLGGLVMVATWQQHRMEPIERRPG
jgi:hypothetical protein